MRDLRDEVHDMQFPVPDRRIVREVWRLVYNVPWINWTHGRWWRL